MEDKMMSNWDDDMVMIMKQASKEVEATKEEEGSKVKEGGRSKFRFASQGAHRSSGEHGPLERWSGRKERFAA